MRLAKLGFSIIEIIVTITILGILLTIGFNSYKNQKLKAEANQIISDAQTIGKLFDSVYDTGHFKNLYVGEKGTFPNTIEMFNKGWATKIMTEYDSNSQLKFIAAANNSPIQPVNNFSTDAFRKANLNSLIYQPLSADGNLCKNPSEICYKYRLFYFYKEPSSYNALFGRTIYKYGVITNHEIQK